jgi:hypothetical protein
MRGSRVFSRAALYAPLFLLVSCSERQPLAPTEHPRFSIIARAPQSTLVDVNNIRLQLNPDGLGLGTRLGHPFLYAGGVAYGTGGSSIVWWDTRGQSGSGLLAVSGLRVSRPGPVADHQTVSLLADGHSQAYGPNTPPRLFVVQETFAFSAAADADYVMVKYTLYNPGPATVSGLYAGQVLDLDVGADAGQNFVHYTPSDQSVRQFMFAEPFMAGHILLGGAPTTYRIWQNGDNPPLPPLSVDPTTWTQMFDFLSGGMVGPDFAGPRDLRDLLGHEPVSLAAGASRAFAFGLLAADDWLALDENVVSARARFAALPASTRGPYPIAPVRVAIVPRELLLAAPGVMLAQITFASADVARRFDVPSARCAGAQPQRSQLQKDRVSLTFDRADVDPGAIIGGRLVCGGFLSDGTAWIGDDTVTVGDKVPGVVSATVTQLTSGPRNDMHADWSPDGRSIAFSSELGGEVGVYRMNVDSGPSSIISLASSAMWPAWSPDGKTILIVGATPGTGMSAVPAAGGAAVRLVDRGGGMPAWSPDGSTIAFVRNGGQEIWVMDAVGELQGGASHAVVTAGFSNMYPHWGRDGLLYFVARGRPDDTTSAIFRADPAMGEPSVVRVTPIGGATNFSPAVSRDGRALAFGSQVPGARRELVLQGLRTGEQSLVQFSTPSLGIQDRVEWSPDGHRILFSWGGDIYVADVGHLVWRGGP